MRILAGEVPTSAAVGVPERWPVAVLKVSQRGLSAMRNDRVRFFGLAIVGVNEYACPTVTLCGGEPEIASPSAAVVACAAVAAPQTAPASNRWRSGLQVKNDPRSIVPPQK